MAATNMPVLPEPSNPSAGPTIRSMPSVQSFKSAKTSYSLRGFGHGSDTVAIHGHSTDNLAYSIRCDSDTTLANSEVSDRGEGFMRQKSQANIKSRSGESINSVGYSFSTSTLNNSSPECSASADSKIDMNDSSTSYESNRSRRFSRSYSWSSKFSPKAKSIRSFSMSASDTSVDSRFDSRNHHESDTKVYKKLKSQLNKYKNKYGAGKTNHLRITLLTFLRESNDEDNPHYESNSQNNNTDYQVQILGLWWEALLDDITGSMKNISGFDRNAFYEGISAIMSRPEWKAHRLKNRFQQLLKRTCLHVVIKTSSLLHSTIPLSAFFGKVLAYSFIYIPGFAMHIFKVLLHPSNSPISNNSQNRPNNSKQKERTSNAQSQHQKSNSKESHKSESGRAKPSSNTHSAKNSENIKGSQGSNCDLFIRLTKKLVEQPMINTADLPEHLVSLCCCNPIPNEPYDVTWLGNFRDVNCLRPLKVDSSLFSSFFKHLCSLQTQFFPRNFMDIPNPESLILSAPGMLSIFLVVVRNIKTLLTSFILQHYVRGVGPRISSTMANNNSRNSSSSSGSSSRSSSSSSTFSTTSSTSASAYTTMPIKMHIDQLKIFVAIREILHSDKSTCLYFPVFSRSFDLIFKSLALETKVFDMDACVTVCDISEEWLSSVFLVRTSKAVPSMLHCRGNEVDWNFWVTVAVRMFESNNTCTEMRAITFLYNIWQHLPTDVDFLCRVISMVLSKGIWLQFFCHWNPLVRSYYHRFLCYRVLTTSGPSESLHFAKQILTRRLDETYVWLRNMSANANLMPESAPSLPLPRMRIGISTVNANQRQPYKQLESGTTRLHPFEIFDNAAYWLNEDSQPSFAPIVNSNSYKDPKSLNSLWSSPSLSDLSSTSRCASDTATDASSFSSSVPSPEGFNNPLDKVQRGNNNDLVRSVETTSIQDTADPGSTNEVVAQYDRCDVKADSEKKPSKSDIARKFSFFRKIIPKRQVKTKYPIKADKSVKTVKNSENNENNASLTEDTLKELPSHSTPDLTPPKASRPHSIRSNFSSKDNALSPKLFSPRSPSLSSLHSLVAPRTPKSPSAASNTSGSTIGSGNDKYNKKRLSITCPGKLQEPRPEIVKSPHKFILVQTMLVPKPTKELAIPNLPFTKRKSVLSNGSFDIDSKRNLMVWNYAGRSLSEWNVQIFCFEKFIEQNTKELGSRYDELEMPFLVAEIPWREIQSQQQ